MVNGKNIFILAGEDESSATIIAGTRSNEVRVTCDNIEVSSPTSGQWREYLAGRSSWTVSTGFLVGDASRIKDLLKVRKHYYLVFASKIEDTTTIELKGVAILTECQITATIGNLVQGSFRFVGTGPVVDPNDTSSPDLPNIPSAPILPPSSGGGGGCECEVVEEDYMDDVILIDFDGKVLYRYTAEEFMALTEMPPNPTYEYLTSLGWNWTLEEAHNYVGLYGKLTIGQDYKPTDGKTRLFITLDNPDFLTPSLNLAANKCNIDWGDGSAVQEVSGTGVVSHQYTSVGDYIITMEATTGVTRLGASNEQKNRCFGSDINNLRCLRKAYIGDGVYPNLYAFESCENLSQVTGTKITSYSYCYEYTGLKALIYPRTYTGSGYKECQCCFNLKVASLPGNWKTTYLYSTFAQSGIVRLELPIYPFAPNSCCDGCINLRHIIIPDGITQLNGNLCAGGRIAELVIPNSVTQIQSIARGSYNLKKIYIGSGVTDMNSAYIFRESLFIEEVHIAAVTPPTLQSSAFPAAANFTGTIYVPAESVEAYKTATNWSAYADKIVAEP